MKKILIIKTSSLGDIIHTLPALTDAMRALDVKFDWVVEEGFADIPALHPAVDKVIPVSLRRWRKNFWFALKSGEFMRFFKALRQTKYDAIIDAQGLLKSAGITTLARGPSIGADWHSAREPVSAWFYRRRIRVASRHEQQATERMRELFAKALGYAIPHSVLDYGIVVSKASLSRPYCVFLHGTTWATKHWPEPYWITLAQKLISQGLAVYLPWGNEVERLRAERISAASGATVLVKMNIKDLSVVLAGATAVVAVDTGLAHLSAALKVPCVAIYGATNPALTGVMGEKVTIVTAQFVCAPCLKRHCTYKGPHPVEPPCYGSVNPEVVWQALSKWVQHGPV